MRCRRTLLQGHALRPRLCTDPPLIRFPPTPYAVPRRIRSSSCRKDRSRYRPPKRCARPHCNRRFSLQAPIPDLVRKKNHKEKKIFFFFFFFFFSLLCV